MDDASVAISILEQVEGPVARFTADGADDTRSMYEALVESGAANIRIVIPPKKTATVDSRATGLWCQRNEAIERIGEDCGVTASAKRGNPPSRAMQQRRELDLAICSHAIGTGHPRIWPGCCESSRRDMLLRTAILEATPMKVWSSDGF